MRISLERELRAFHVLYQHYYVNDILVLTYALYPLWVVPKVKMQHWRLTMCIVWTLHPALGVKAPQIILHTLRRCAIDVSPIKSTAFELQR